MYSACSQGPGKPDVEILGETVKRENGPESEQPTDGSQAAPAKSRATGAASSSSGASTCAGVASLGDQLAAKVKKALPDGGHNTHSLTHTPDFLKYYLQMYGMLEALTEAQSFSQYVKISTDLDNTLEACKQVWSLVGTGSMQSFVIGDARLSSCINVQRRSY